MCIELKEIDDRCVSCFSKTAGYFGGYIYDISQACMLHIDSESLALYYHFGVFRLRSSLLECRKSPKTKPNNAANLDQSELCVPARTDEKAGGVRV